MPRAAVATGVAAVAAVLGADIDRRCCRQLEAFENGVEFGAIVGAEEHGVMGEVETLRRRVAEFKLEADLAQAA